MKIKYIIPFYYTWHSRSNGLHFISYFTMVILPQFLLCLFFRMPSDNLKFMLSFLVAFTGMLSTYEFGYIVNDSICIRKDPHPSKRIDDNEQQYLRENIIFISVLKILISFFCVALLYFFVNQKNALLYLCCILVLIVTYIIHNSNRSFVNFITVFILTTFNYISSVCAICPTQNFLICFLIIVISFSIPKTFFYILRKLFNYEDRYGFVIFYFFETFVFIILCFVFDLNKFVVFIPLSQFMWRLFTFALQYKKIGGVKK